MGNPRHRESLGDNLEEHFQVATEMQAETLETDGAREIFIEIGQRGAARDVWRWRHRRGHLMDAE